ncbi:M23 family metallopeptidase [Frigidibacter oleivorans]|uniref:M23 family metallopeptidase n=1 Tax=Frigidibacter oleivorans TaxID=2487129 RepID=UPI000F8D0780|nr:M23 family metallopeptidase [Frigidibacter oleivorans]
MQIDPRFRAARAQAQRRRSRGRWRWMALALVAGLMVPAGLWQAGLLSIGPRATAPAPDPDAVAADEAAAAYASVFIDVPGDPMILHFDSDAGAENARRLLRPLTIPADRAGSDLMLVRDTLLIRDERLMTTLPSSREDFAFFQAQRTAPAAQPAPSPVLAQTGQQAEKVVTVAADADASWGETLAGEPAAAVSFAQTRIENTTSLAYVRPEAQRRPAYADMFLRLSAPQDLASVLTGQGLDAAASAAFAEGAAAALPGSDQLAAGTIVAIRAVPEGEAQAPVQLSLYTRDDYIGSLAREGRQVVVAADPWVEEDLFSFAGDRGPVAAGEPPKFRLLDAFYSAAIRNGVPSGVVGESIVLMSQAFDMESFATPNDRMALLYAPEPGSAGPGPGQVLYAAIDRGGSRLECHVFRPADSGEFRCFGAPGAAGAAIGGALRAGMLTPVNGVLTSGFGPRMHPVLKVARLHRGVDWAAPVGTPVVAAFDGEVAFAGDGGGYGNLVRIAHANGTETRYAHLSAFAEGLAVGQRLRAGDPIGFVGTTGLSTGPHLHFELYERGDSVDPFTSGAVVAGGAVDLVTDRIIHVESAGNAAAKNALSTATGLGQFVEATWLRMMRTYRPDLAGSLTREELLALRLDPSISREMVANLAREGEAYLRARGHEITPGRLYLCHFLGAEGAHAVLSAADDMMLDVLLGQAVVAANPFLKGHDVAFVKGWADQKMGGAAAVRVAVVPPEVRAYEQVIDTILEGA